MNDLFFQIRHYPVSFDGDGGLTWVIENHRCMFPTIKGHDICDPNFNPYWGMITLILDVIKDQEKLKEAD